MVTMRWLVGYVFDGWNALMFGIEEMGKAIDRAMDVWDD